MGRTNRSRKRRDEMNRIKRERYAAKELERLKKTLGLIDKDGNVVMKDVSELATSKSSEEIRKGKNNKVNDILHELDDKEDEGENITVVNEKTGKTHKYNTITFRDEHGSYPPWFKPKKTPKRIRKLNHARKQQFKQSWTTSNVPL